MSLTDRLVGKTIQQVNAQVPISDVQPQALTSLTLLFTTGERLTIGLAYGRGMALDWQEGQEASEGAL